MATPVSFRAPTGVRFGSAGAAGAQVWWNDSWMKQGVLSAFRGASMDTGNLARANAPASRIARSISVRTFSGGAATGLDVASIVRASSPLAHLFELGVDPHGIAPRNSVASLIERGRNSSSTRQGRSVRKTSPKGSVGEGIALKFPGGGFARGTVEHPGMAEEPFMRPAAAAFPGFFNSRLRRVF